MSDNITDLLKSIEQGSDEEKWEAAKELCSILQSQILAPLLVLLQKGASPTTRAATAYVLGSSRLSLARTSLEEVLTNATEASFVRGHAAEALAYICNRESVPWLLKGLAEPSPEIKYWSIFALGEIGSPEAVPALNAVAESMNDQQYEKSSLRDEALQALAKIGAKSVNGG